MNSDEYAMLELESCEGALILVRRTVDMLHFEDRSKYEGLTRALSKTWSELQKLLPVDRKWPLRSPFDRDRILNAEG